jgi:perosamine synthetase
MIPHNRPTFNNDEINASDKVIRSGWVSQGNEVTLFEKELCNFFNLPEGHALAVSSGSAALYLSLWILGGRNKNIGLPVYACAALRNAIGLIEGNPIYYDCKIGTPNLDITKIDPNDIDILIAPSMFGIPLDIPNTHKYKVIEDIAQSFGAKFNNKRIGLRGDIGICSFYATKMITSGGQGGYY